MPMWGYSYSMGFGGWAMGALLLACLAAFGLIIWALLSVAERREHHAEPLAPGALETLQRRYALGELDEPTFLRMREQLGATSQMSADDAAHTTPDRVGAGAR